MIQTFLPDENFLEEKSFEKGSGVFLIRAEILFARCFGDREYIPRQFKIKLKNQEILMIKTDMLNDGTKIILSYEGQGQKVEVYL